MKKFSLKKFLVKRSWGVLFVFMLTLFQSACHNNSETNNLVIVNSEDLEKASPSMVLHAGVSKFTGEQRIMIALLLDTSGSMDGLLDQAKAQLWKVVNELAKAKSDDGTDPKLEIAIYEYGNTKIPASEGFIRMVLNLTSDLDDVSEKLFELTTNGGDEFCGQVINSSLKQLDWSASDTDLKMIFIAGNEPFNQGNVSYEKVCKEAKEKGIFVNTIYCGDYDEGTQTFWRRGAKLTGGSYMNIDQNNKTVFIETPFDDKIDRLNTQLNDTYIYYGNEGLSKKNKQITQDLNANSYSLSNKVSRSMSKVSGYYRADSWDLVDAYKADTTFAFSKVKNKTLPDSLQKLSAVQLKDYVLKKSEKRNAIQAEIRKLGVERQAYITKTSSATADSDNMLDVVLIKSIKKHAEAKKMTFKD